MFQVLTTDNVAPRQRVAFWQEMVSQTFVQAHCDSNIGEAFHGSICTETFAQTEISRIDAGQQLIDRRASDIARSCKPRFYLCYQAAGRARFRERHAENVLCAGEMILLDNCEPYSVEYEDTVTEIVLHVPHEVLRERFRCPERVLGHKLGRNSGMARMTAEFLMSCASHAEALDPAQRPMLANLALNLFAEVLAEEVGERSEAGTHQAVLLARIKQHVLARLSEPHLDLARVAGAMGLSVRYLSRLFQIDGLSFGRYLLHQRIERCRLELANPQFRNLHVGEIALRCGFNNLAHFSRAFRAAMGCTPSEYRALSLAQ